MAANNNEFMTGKEFGSKRRKCLFKKPHKWDIFKTKDYKIFHCNNCGISYRRLRRGLANSLQFKINPNFGMRGKHHKEESKEKSRLSHLGKKRYDMLGNKFREGKISWNKGLTKEMDNRVHSGPTWNKGLTRERDQRLKYNDLQKGKHHHPQTEFKKGEHPSKITEFGKLENHPNWLGGLSFEPYGLEFNNRLKEQIRQRDDHRCQQCFRHQNELKKKLSIHHIDFNKKNNSPSNLISLCSKCHMQTNYNRDGWTNYFNNTINQRVLNGK